MPKNPHADFSPVLKGYSGQSPFKFWCQMALPLTYDDSLSYYELLNKVVSYLNNTISDVANVEDNVGSLLTSFTQLQDYVNAYFDELDVEAELKNILDEMVEDGSLSALIKPIVDSDVPPSVTEWLNENIPTGETVVVDRSLSIADAAADAKTTGDIISILKNILTNNNSVEIISSNKHTDRTHNNIDFVWDGTNKIHVEGTASSFATSTLMGSTNSFPDFLTPGNSYKLKIEFSPETTGLTFQIRYYIGETLYSADYTENGVYNVDIPADAISTYIRLTVNANRTVDSDVYLYLYTAPSNEELYNNIYHYFDSTSYTNENKFSLSDMSEFSYTYAYAGRFNESPEDINEAQYVLIVKTPSNNLNLYYITLYNHNTGDYYIGRYNSSGGSIEWSKQASKAYVDSELANVTEPLTTSEVSNLTSIFDVNPGKYFSANGARLKELIYNAPDILNNSITYQVYTWKYASTARIIEIFGLASGLHFVGRTTIAAPETITWVDRSYDTVMSAVDDHIDAKTEATVYEFYSDFQELAGWYSGSSGNISYTSDERYKHSQKLKIRPDTDYFMGYVQGSTVVGAFFDINGDFIRPLYHTTSSNPNPDDDFVKINPSRSGGDNTYYPAQYVLPDGCLEINGVVANDPNKTLFPESSFMPLFKFHSPVNAAYVSINLPSTVRESTSTSEIERYRTYISSKPIFIPNGSGNIVIKESDALYQKYKNKKLCIIGPSTVAINRLYRYGRTGSAGNYTERPGFVNPGEVYKNFYNIISDPSNKYIAKSGYISGFEEYCKPYFLDARSFGFSGASMANGRGSSNKCSIYTALCGGTDSFRKTESGQSVNYTYTVSENETPDFSDYDVFLITWDGNGINSNDASAVSESENTYIGALQGICEKILNDNAYAEIYLCTFIKKESYGTLGEDISEKIRKYASDISCNLIDLANEYNGIRNGMGAAYTKLSYDNQHRNNFGNSLLGYAIRKSIIGF